MAYGIEQLLSVVIEILLRRAGGSRYAFVAGEGNINMWATSGGRMPALLGKARSGVPARLQGSAASRTGSAYRHACRHTCCAYPYV
jgi:hypothetical protein